MSENNLALEALPRFLNTVETGASTTPIMNKITNYDVYCTYLATVRKLFSVHLLLRRVVSDGRF